jgi:ADP-ribosylglycohydrolase
MEGDKTMDNSLNSPLYKKSLGCLLGGLIGDAIGAPAENMAYEDIEKKFGWIDDFDSDGTDDTLMKNLLADALVRSGGYATLDDWARQWIDQSSEIFGYKVGKFFQSVLHTAAKLRMHSLPRMAALGNMPSSSSAMCISPVGIVNACNPRAAAAQAYGLAGLIHVHDVGFCQDGAAAMAAAVAEAFKPGSSRDSVVRAALEAIIPWSGKELRGLVAQIMEVACAKPEYKDFRAEVYARQACFFKRITCDSRETIPIALALFWLADGDVEQCVACGANFGRDADTIASMAGAIAGAFSGIDAIRSDWVEKALRRSARDQEQLARDLVRTALAKMDRESESMEMLKGLAQPG